MKQLLALLIVAALGASPVFAGGHSCCQASSASSTTTAAAKECPMDKADCKKLMKDANCAQHTGLCKDKSSCPAHGVKRQTTGQVKKAKPSKLTMKAGS